jgi:ribonuclease HII
MALELEQDGICVGIDEVGRGPLAGPVAAAAVIVPDGFPRDLAAAIDDSKRLPAAVRTELAAEIRARATVGVGFASVADIDRVNILQASFLAMGAALDGLGVRADVALVDGNRPPPLPCRVCTVVGGDGLSLSIAAASIVAKVARDALMVELAETFPGYGWETNMGYSTATHLDALDRLGATPHHRRSFAPVARILERDVNTLSRQDY